MNTELRLSDTNAASDSKGRTWGLDGGLFWWLVAGVGLGITLFLVSLMVLNNGLLSSAAAAAVPVALCLAYIFGLRQGKPPGYDADLMEHVLSGVGFGPDPQNRPDHPLVEPGQSQERNHDAP